jgi:hypothetical protein
VEAISELTGIHQRTRSYPATRSTSVPTLGVLIILLLAMSMARRPKSLCTTPRRSIELVEVSQTMHASFFLLKARYAETASKGVVEKRPLDRSDQQLIDRELARLER